MWKTYDQYIYKYINNFSIFHPLIKTPPRLLDIQKISSQVYY